MSIANTFTKTEAFNLIPITEDTITLIEQACLQFEMRGSHPLALNTPLLGVTPIKFTEFDRNLFFHILKIDEKYLEKQIKIASVSGEEWIVVNDPYNQLVIYTAHRVLISDLPEEIKERGLLALFKLLNYKFFTSYVGHVFQHGADKGIMELTIKNLSNKYDIIQLGTWKKVIEVRAKDTYDRTSIHYKTFTNYPQIPDKNIFYVITDTRARIVSKIRLIQNAYYNNHKDEQSVGSYGLSSTVDGEMVITDTEDLFNRVISGMINQVQTTARFIDNELIKIICSKYAFLSPDILRTLLTMLTDRAKLQVASNTTDKIVSATDEQDEYYEGVFIFIRELLQKTFRYCVMSGIPLNSRGEILKKANNLFTSSRISDKDILMLKRSAVIFVLECELSKRDTTNQVLTLCLLTYILIRALKLM